MRFLLTERVAVSSANDITRLLGAVRDGQTGASDSLLPLVYEELRKLAKQRMVHLPPGQTLQPTALVHEAYVRLVGSNDPTWDSRGHFFAAAAQAMRNILVDQARRRSRLKRGGDRERVELAEVTPCIEAPSLDVLALDEALDRLRAKDRLKSDIVMLRYFAGLTVEETAEVLSVSTATVDRHWSYARAWLHREISKGNTDAGG